jgi:hypothetical protein
LSFSWSGGQASLNFPAKKSSAKFLLRRCSESGEREHRRQAAAGRDHCDRGGQVRGSVKIPFMKWRVRDAVFGFARNHVQIPWHFRRGPPPPNASAWTHHLTVPTCGPVCSFCGLHGPYGVETN